MSTLKQSVLKVVKKGDIVLNSYDANAAPSEGYVYESRWSAKTYDPSTAEGFPLQAGELLRFTNEDTVTGDDFVTILEAKQDAALVVNGDVAPINVEATDLDVIKGFVNEDKDVYKYNNKYFTRNYAVYSASGSLEISAVHSNQAAFIDDKNLLPTLLTSDTNLFNGVSPAGLDWFFASEDGFRQFSDKYFGLVEQASKVPNSHWFYYAGDIGGSHSSAAGFYLNKTGADLKFTGSGADDAIASALTVDQAGLDSGSITQYVWALSTGGVQVLLNDAQGFALLSDAVAPKLEDIIANAIAKPAGNTGWWTEVGALTEPATIANGNITVTESTIIDTTDANSLTDINYWNLISENFVNDYDQTVGSTGVVGANPAGSYASTYSDSTASSTVRTLDVEEFTNATTTVDAKITITDHGLETADSILIAGIDNNYDGSQVVTVIDKNTFSIDGSASTANVAWTSGGTVTVSGKTNHVWYEVSPPTVDQALLYRF
jgi:hypothetical protein